MKASLLFPAIRAELLVVAVDALGEKTVRVVSDIHDKDVDATTFYFLAIAQILDHAQKMGADPGQILAGVLRLAGGKVDPA